MVPTYSEAQNVTSRSFAAGRRRFFWSILSRCHIFPCRKRDSQVHFHINHSTTQLQSSHSRSSFPTTSFFFCFLGPSMWTWEGVELQVCATRPARDSWTGLEIYRQGFSKLWQRLPYRPGQVLQTGDLPEKMKYSGENAKMMINSRPKGGRKNGITFLSQRDKDCVTKPPTYLLRG